MAVDKRVTIHVFGRTIHCQLFSGRLRVLASRCGFANSNLGNGLLEFVLLLPVLILLLLGIVDTGIALKERAYLTDAVRAGAHDGGVSLRENKPLVWSASYELEVDFNKVRDIVNSTASAISQQVKSIKKEDNLFAVNVSAILLNIDKRTGRLIDYSVLYATKTANGFSLQSEAPKYPYVTMSEFLSRAIDNNNEPNEFAIIAGPAYDVKNGTLEPRYYEKSIVLCTEVEAVADAYSRDYLREVVGEVFAFQHQEIVSLRGDQL